MTYPQQKAKIKRRGFTLIEALVAISILLVGILGPFMLTNMNLQAGLFSRDQITAYYLAQEAIEMVREVRDENFIQRQRRMNMFWISPWDWLRDLDECIDANTANGCRVDGRRGVSLADRFRPCTNCAQGDNSRLFVNPGTGEYGLAGTTASRFSRHVRIERIEQFGEVSRVIVHVHVSFDTGTGLGRQTYHTTDHLKNWSPF